MSMLPEAKLDILLAHHASLEAELLGQVNSENYVRITRELAELNPLIDAVKAYRATAKEMTDIDALIADWSREGIVMHAETLAIQAAHRARHLAFVIVPLWITALALAGIAVALLVGR